MSRSPGRRIRRLSQLSPAAVGTYGVVLSLMEDLSMARPWIDVGCGDLTFSWIVERTLGRSLIGFDVVWRGNVSTESSFVLSDASRIPVSSRSVDLLLSNFLLEHLDRPGEFLSEVCRVLSANGIALISVNGSNWHIARLVRFLVEEVPRNPKRLSGFLRDPLHYLSHGREWSTGSARPRSVFQELREWSPKEWQGLFEDAGLRVLRRFASANILSLVSYGFVRRRNSLEGRKASRDGIHLTYLVSPRR